MKSDQVMLDRAILAIVADLPKSPAGSRRREGRGVAVQQAHFGLVGGIKHLLGLQRLVGRGTGGCKHVLQ